jgi:hypothetical protein
MKNMNKGDYIRVTKLKSCENPRAITPSKSEYVPGQDNGNVSLPVDYWAEGYLLNDLKVGGILMLDRRIRDGICAYGCMNTTAIKKITKTSFETQNSIYLVEKVENK